MLAKKPESIKVIEDWGRFTIQAPFSDFVVSVTVTGNLMYLEATEEQFKEGIREFDGVWVGIDAAQLQQFEMMHVK